LWQLAFDERASRFATAVPVFDATKHRADVVISLCSERDGRGKRGEQNRYRADESAKSRHPIL
jgi:hypothetical protein